MDQSVRRARCDSADGKGWISSLLIHVVPAAIAALLGWLALRYAEDLLATHFLTGGPKENAVAEKARWPLFVYFLAMVAGMMAQTVWQAIHNRRAGKPPVFDKWEFAKPALVAPIAFLVVYQSVTVVMLIFAFQNGFFWQTVLRTAKR
jgi:predicted membrane channel-forming protein YqfA (hemolysin III family)